MVWTGLGVNYKSPNKIATDAVYFNQIGVNKIRVHLPAISSAAQMAEWLAVAQQWYDRGFYTIYGGSVLPGTGSATDWNTYRTNILAYATSLASGVRKMTEFQIGNELELYVDGTTLTQTQLRANVRALATEVKAILPAYIISYTTSFYQDYSQWAAEGVGDLDKLGVNVYGNVQTAGARWNPSYRDSAKLSTVISALTTKVYISEFGVDATNTSLQSLSRNDQARFMRVMLADLKASGITSAYLYSFRGYKDQDDQFAAVLTTDVHTPMWNVLATNNGRLSITQ